MPKYWYDRRSVSDLHDEDNEDFYMSIVADRKPYFMRYVYPNVMREYNTYIKTTEKNAMREFAMTIEEMMSAECDALPERALEFLFYYKSCMPVGIGGCTMNRICRRIEREFDGYLSVMNSASEFDYTVLRCDSATPYTKSQFNAIKSMIASYNKKLKEYQVFASRERIDEDDFYGELSAIDAEFISSCEKICPNEDILCNIVLDICYSTDKSKRFAWRVSGEAIVSGLLHKHGGVINVPTLDPDGDVEYAGKKYSVISVNIGDEDNDPSE